MQKKFGLVHKAVACAMSKTPNQTDTRLLDLTPNDAEEMSVEEDLTDTNLSVACAMSNTPNQPVNDVIDLTQDSEEMLDDEVLLYAFVTEEKR